MPAKIQGGWLDALQHVFLHSDTVSSPTVVFFAPGIPIPAASLSRARGEGAKPTARGLFSTDGDGKEPSTLVALTSAGNKTRAAQGQAGCPLPPRCSCVCCRDQGLNSCCLPWKAAEELRILGEAGCCVRVRIQSELCVSLC